MTPQLQMSAALPYERRNTWMHTHTWGTDRGAANIHHSVITFHQQWEIEQGE